MDIKIGDKVIDEDGGELEIVGLPGTSKLFPDYYRGITEDGAYGLLPFEEIVSVNGVGIGILARAEARIAELEKALEPFGALAESYDESFADDDDATFADEELTVGDLRRAAALLKEDNQ